MEERSSNDSPQHEPSRNHGQERYVEAEMVREARRGPRRSGAWGKLGLGVLLVALGLSVLMNLVLLSMLPSGLLATRDKSLKEQYHSLDRLARDKIAIVTVDGAILDTDGFVKKQIERVKRDKSIKGVVLRVNSPGGSVSASDYLYHHLKQMREEREIPMVVSMGGICASGGYYLSMSVGDAERSIFAEPTTWTGSIGVILPHYNLAGLLDEWKIEEDSVKSHPLKGIGSITKQMTPEERDILQALVDDSFDRFKQIVASGRPYFAEHAEALDLVATGQVFTAAQAKHNGLVDEIGFVEDAIERVLELANLSKDDVRVVEYKHTPSLADLLTGRTNTPGVDLKTLLDLSVPRAYYLCTTLPSLLQ